MVYYYSPQREGQRPLSIHTKAYKDKLVAHGSPSALQSPRHKMKPRSGFQQSDNAPSPFFHFLNLFFTKRLQTSFKI